MNSRVIAEFPYRSVELSAFKRDCSEAPEYIERELLRAVKPYITWSEGGAIAGGDVAVCALKSDAARYDRERVKLTVGLGMLPASIEEALVGREAGGSFEVQAEGAAVFVTVLEVQKKTVPEPEDFMIEALGIPGVATVEAYRDYLFAEWKKEDFLKHGYEATEYLVSQVISRSELLIREEDWQACVDWGLGRIRCIARSEGLVLERMTEAEFEGRIPVKTYDGLVARMQKDAWRECALGLLGRALARRDGLTFDEAGYRDYVKERAEAVSMSPEAYGEACCPYECYEDAMYQDYFYQKAEEYVRQTIYGEV